MLPDVRKAQLIRAGNITVQKKMKRWPYNRTGRGDDTAMAVVFASKGYLIKSDS